MQYFIYVRSIEIDVQKIVKHLLRVFLEAECLHRFCKKARK